MHFIDVNRTNIEKARRNKNKNSESYFEQILEATPHKTLVVRPLTSYLTNYPSKVNKAWEAETNL